MNDGFIDKYICICIIFDGVLENSIASVNVCFYLNWVLNLFNTRLINTTGKWDRIQYCICMDWGKIPQN